MSFFGTLAKVAVGVVIAKGVGNAMQAARQGGPGRAGTGSTFGGAQSPGAAAGSGVPGGLQDMMRDVLAGTPAGKTGPTGSAGSAALPGGLGGLLEQLAGGAPAGGTTRAGTGATGGGLNDLLGSLAGSGGLGGLLGGLAGAVAGGSAGARPASGASQDANAGFGDLLNQSLRNFGEPDVAPAPEQDAAAALLLRAMIQAAKADGKVDEAERVKLMDGLADADQAEVDFVKAELAAPVDIEGLARQVPKGLEAQVYTMSVMAITLDQRSEAQYLHELATALGLDPARVNSIHAQLDLPTIYS